MRANANNSFQVSPRKHSPTHRRYQSQAATLQALHARKNENIFQVSVRNHKTLLSSKRRFGDSRGRGDKSSDLVEEGIYHFKNNKMFSKGNARSGMVMHDNSHPSQSQFFRKRQMLPSKMHKYLDAAQHISIKVQDNQNKLSRGRHGQSVDTRNAYRGDLITADPLLERATSIERATEHSVSNLSTLTMDQNNLIQNQMLKLSQKRGNKSVYLGKVDTNQLLYNIQRTIKGMRYKLSTLVSNGEYHTRIDSTVEKRIEVIPETLIYCKIPCKDEFSPGKVMITYEGDSIHDLQIHASLTNPMPTQENCTKTCKDVKSFKIFYDSQEVNNGKVDEDEKFNPLSSNAPQFSNSFIYLTLFSALGTSVKFLVKFANEDGLFAPRKRFENEEISNQKAQLALDKIRKELVDEKQRDDIIQKNIRRVSFWKDITSANFNRNILTLSDKNYEERHKYAKEKRHRLFISKITKLEVAKNDKEFKKRIQFLMKRRHICARAMLKQLYLKQMIFRLYSSFKERLTDQE